MKKVLITGASGGIGLETAKVLSRQNYQVTLLARNKQKLENALKQLEGSGHRMIPADLTKKEEVVALKGLLEEEHFHVLINNAGVGLYGGFTRIPLPDQFRMMEINMNALTALSYDYLNQATSGNSLINIASILGESSLPGAAVYAATKAYVIALSNALWAEYKKKGIFVSAFCPGATATAFHKESGGSTDSFPKFIMQKPEYVARGIARTIQRRSKPRVISGFVNKMMLFSGRLVPNKTIVNIMAGFSPVTYET